MKKLQNNQRGIAHLAIVLVILAIGLVGFAGWYVWDSNKEASQTIDDLPSGQQNNQEKLPEGYVEYRNQELGFRFAYPEEWGTAKIEPGWETQEKHSVSGSDYLITFSANKDIEAAIQTKDWKHNDVGHGTSSATGFINYQERYQEIVSADAERKAGNDSYATTVLQDGNTYLLYADYDCMGGGHFISGIAKLNKNLPGLQIHHQTDETGPSDLWCGGDQGTPVANVIDKTVQEQLHEVLKSVKDL